MTNPTHAPPRRKLSDIFGGEEIAALTARSDLMGWRAVLLCKPAPAK